MAKKFPLFIFLVLCIFPLVSAYGTSSTPSIHVTLMSQTPDPVQPGDIVTVKFKIENNGSETNNDALVTLLPQYPVSLYGDVAQKNIGKLRALNSGANAIIVEYKLKIDEQATEGDLELELNVKFGESGISYTNNEFLLHIQTQDSILDITSISFDPEQIKPGESTQATITIKNLADSLLRNLKFKLNLTSSGIPFAPYQSSSERIIAQLPSGYQKAITFNLIADPKGAAGLYKVPLEISYYDEKGKLFTTQELLAISLGDIPKVQPFIKKTSVLQAAENGKITIEIANPGTADIRYLQLYVLPSDEYTLLSPNDYFYIGNIDADDTQSEELEIYITPNTKLLHLPIKLKYFDANGKQFQQQFDLTMNLYTTSQLETYGKIPTNYTWVYIVILFLSIGGYVAYRKYNLTLKKILKYQ